MTELLRVAVLLLELVALAFGAQKGSSCVTPNKENAQCLGLSSCKIISDELKRKRATGISEELKTFLRQSQCGYDGEPLVCCGTSLLPDNPVIFDPSSASATLPFQHSLLPSAEVCGTESEQYKIVGGEKTIIGEFPWTALLHYIGDDGEDDGFKCGGTLISKRYVLTAAHCVFTGNSGSSLDYARLGEWKLSTDTDCDKNDVCADPVVDVNVEKTISHQSYRRKPSHHDIALVRLQRSVAFTDFIRPICLPSPISSEPAVGAKLFAAGWGRTENGAASDEKLKVKLPVVSQQQCSTRLIRRGVITENHLCAGAEEGKDSCQGDSGGPLMRLEQNNGPDRLQYFLEGVISWGVDCGRKGFPGVYTRVSKYTDWIASNLEP